jgi:hypothetical protein
MLINFSHASKDKVIYATKQYKKNNNNDNKKQKQKQNTTNNGIDCIDLHISITFLIKKRANEEYCNMF